MRKILGIIYLFIAIALIAFGVMSLTNFNAKKDSFEARIRHELSETYREEERQQQVLGYVSLAGGVILVILGIMKTTGKSR